MNKNYLLLSYFLLHLSCNTSDAIKQEITEFRGAQIELAKAEYFKANIECTINNQKSCYWELEAIDSS